MTDFEQNETRSQKKARRDVVEALRKTLASDHGRVVLRWVLDQAGLFEDSFTGNSQTFYREGRRSLGLEILSAMNVVDPYEFVRLLKEGADDIVEKRNKARKESADV